MKSNILIHNHMRIQARTLAFLAALAMTSYSSPAQTNALAEHIEGYKEHLIAGSKWYQHDPDRPQPPVVTPGATFSQGAPPPSDAETLFDGKEPSRNGKTAAEGLRVGKCRTVTRKSRLPATSAPGGSGADFQLHVEFSEPILPAMSMARPAATARWLRRSF